MTKLLDGLAWKPMWTSHLGCIQACLQHLGVHVSDAWLFGATGHAFVINVHPVVCPSGPTAWRDAPILQRLPHVGGQVSTIFAARTEPNFQAKQREAWDATRSAIDAGVPCYGWELLVPEYYVINGYDDAGYLFSGPRPDASPSGDPKPWQELGTTEIGVLSVARVDRCDAADDVTTVRDALDLALEFAQSPDDWIFPEYRAGLPGYDLWIDATETGRADAFGVSYNAAVWTECRTQATEFLREASRRLEPGPGEPCATAAESYAVVANELSQVAELFPFPGRSEDPEDGDARNATLAHLRAAREAEAEGIERLTHAREALN